MISFEASPRAIVGLAVPNGHMHLLNEGYVIPEDAEALCHDVLRHRNWYCMKQKQKTSLLKNIIAGLNADEIPW